MAQIFKVEPEISINDFEQYVKSNVHSVIMYRHVSSCVVMCRHVSSGQQQSKPFLNMAQIANDLRGMVKSLYKNVFTIM